MPILYSDVRALHETGMDDEAIALVRRFQWEDWTTLRFEERASALYRKAVAAMASQIAKANEDADNTASLRAIPESNDEQEAEEGPGLLDTLAEMEEALPRWNDAVGEVREAVERIGLIATSASTSIEKANHAPKPMAARMLVLKKAASQFQIEAEQLKRVSAGFTTDLNEIDAGMRATVALVRLQSDPDEIRAACEFFGVVRALADSSEEGLGALENLSRSIEPLEGLSRDLRGPFRKLRTSLTVLAEGRQVIRNWVVLMNTSGLECSTSEGSHSVTQ